MYYYSGTATTTTGTTNFTSYHNHRDSGNNNNNKKPRIPLALQSIFINGCRGIVVDTPPPNNVAIQTFRRYQPPQQQWTWRRNNKNNNRTSSSSSNGGGTRSRSGSGTTSETESTSITTATSETTTDYGSTSSDQTFICKSPTRTKKNKRPVIPSLSPQQYLDAMLLSRGYSTTTYPTLSTAYYNAPSKLQLASYGIYVTNLMRDGNVEGLNEVMIDSGLSPNACNGHGESIVHTSCRLGNDQLLTVLLEAGGTIQVSDDTGRTPLHDACRAIVSTPNFRLMAALLRVDVQLLFLADNRGHLPLSYIRPEHWSDWLQFLQSKKDEYWPHRNGGMAIIPELSMGIPHSRPVPDPTKQHALSLGLCKMVADGTITPSEAKSMVVGGEKMEVIQDCTTEHDDDDESVCDDDDDDDDDTSIDFGTAQYFEVTETTYSSHNASWSTTEMNDVLDSINSPIKRSLVW